MEFRKLFFPKSAFIKNEISRRFSYWVHPIRKYGHTYENEGDDPESLTVSEFPMKGVKKTLLVVADKCGVGKSTIAVNLALAMKNLFPTKRIGLLDTDPVDPTIPTMMQLLNKKIKREGGFTYPFESFGIHCMFPLKELRSLWAEDDIFETIEYLVREVAWEGLDFLVVDAPTSSSCLHGVFQEQMPMDGCLLVTTGHSIALQMAKNTLNFYQELKVPSAGIVVNFAQHQCLKCQHKTSLYEKNPDLVQEFLGQNVLQSFSLDKEIAQSGEIGQPFIVAYPRNQQVKNFQTLASKVTQFLETPVEKPIETQKEEQSSMGIGNIPSHLNPTEILK